MTGQMTIYRPDGTALLETTIRDDSRYTRRLMGEHSVRLRFDGVRAIPLPYGAYIEWDGVRWHLFADYIPDQQEGVASYDVAFHAPETELQHFTLFYMSQGTLEAQWSLTGTVEQYCVELRHNLERVFGAEVWTVEHHGIDPRVNKHLDLEGVSLWDGLGKVAEAFGCEWWADGRALHLGKLTSAEETTARLGELAYSFTPEGEGNPLIGRLYAFGARRNLSRQYRSNGAIHRLAEPRLHLPAGTPFVEGVPHGIEAVQTFEEVYPRYVGTVSGVSSRPSGDDTIYRILDSAFVVTADKLLEGQTLMVKFETGALAGMEFEAAIVPGGYDLVPNDTYGTRLPSGGLVPVLGDTYVPYGFDISLVGEQYVPEAEAELLRVATEWLAKNNEDRRDIRLETNPVYTYRHNVSLRLGDRMRLVDAIPTGDKVGRITAIEYTLAGPYTVTATIGDTKPEGVLSRLERSAEQEGNRAREYTDRKATDLMRYTARALADAEQAREALQRALGDRYDPAINPISISTMQAIVGDQSLQFAFVRSLTDERVQVPIITFTPYDGRVHVVDGANTSQDLYIKHHTLGIGEIKPHRAMSDYRRWAVRPYRSLPLEHHERVYYLYARVEREGDRGIFRLSPDPIALEATDGVYHLLVAIIGAVASDGGRAITPVYGYSEILPGQIRTGRIVSADGGTYFDLERGEIAGNIRFRGGKDADAFVREVVAESADHSLDYLKPLLRDGTTTIGGGLIATSLIAMRHRFTTRAYIDGRDGVGVAFAAGVKDFGKPTETRAVTIRHDGACAIGEMRVLPGDGRIAYEDGAGIYLTLGADADSLREIVAGVAQSVSYYVSPRILASSGSMLTEAFPLTEAFEVTKDSFVMRVDLTGEVWYGTYSTNVSMLEVVAERTDGTGRIPLWQGAYSVDFRGEARIQGSAPLPKGRYRIALVCTRADLYCTFNIRTLGGNVSGDNQSMSRGRASIGGNGLVVYLSDTQHLSMIKGEPLQYVGKSDLPGVLASGTVRGTKVIRQSGSTRHYAVDNAFGRFVRTDGDALLCTDIGSAGYYFIGHSIGHSHYQVHFSFVGDNVAGFITSYHRGAQGMWVYVLGRNGEMMQADFDYTIIGDNR